MMQNFEARPKNGCFEFRVARRGATRSCLTKRLFCVPDGSKNEGGPYSSKYGFFMITDITGSKLNPAILAFSLVTVLAWA